MTVSSSVFVAFCLFTIKQSPLPNFVKGDNLLVYTDFSHSKVFCSSTYEQNNFKTFIIHSEFC